MVCCPQVKPGENMMRRRAFGYTQLQVSEIGYGGGRISRQDDESSLIRTIHRAVDLGVNFIDTAPNYAGGYSEELIGRALKGRREKVVLATKSETRQPDTIIAEAEESLRRLQTDVLDVIQFHGGWFLGDEAETILNSGCIEAYQTLRDQGKARFFGFSADGPSAGVERLIQSGEFDMIQTNYNLMYQSTHDHFSGNGIIPAAEAQGMGVALMRSTTSGAFPRLMRRAFPKETADIDLDRFLLNYALSNPLVDTALMSLRSEAEAEWADAVSNDIDARFDLRAVHRG